MNPINDVVIVGGGPNGLLLACELALCGVQPIVLERLSEPDTLPKANGLVGRVVQALDYRGLYERFGGSPTPPRPVPSFQFGGLTLNLASLPSHSIYALPIPQRRLEAILDQRARELGVDIRRGSEVLALTQGPDRERVDVDVQALGGPYRLSAKYVVGADGGHSVVRKQCGIEFPGITDEGFVLQQGQVAIDPPVAVPGTGELDVAGVGRFQPFTFNRTATGVFSYGMFKPGVYRVAVIEWGASAVPDDAPMTIDELRETAGRVTGGDIPMREVLAGDDATMVRSSGAKSSRQAERYRQGRVFLVGDAAHVHSGVGGPGLNLGMQDAINLGWKLAGDVRGWAPPGLLDTYESERYPVGKRVIMHSRAQTGLLSPGAYVTAIRELLEELLREPHNVQHIADLMAGADICYDMRAETSGHPLTGRWMPDLALQTSNGATRVAELMRTARPILLNLASSSDAVRLAAGWSDRVDVVTASCSSGDRVAGAVLIRPDGYVAWANDPGNTDGLEHALRTWFGQRASR